MKRRILSLCIAAAMFLTTALGAIQPTVVEAAEPATIVVTGADVLENVGTDVKWEIGQYGGKGTETDKNGDEVTYFQLKDAKYANGLWNVTFDEAGTYEMSFLAAVNKTMPKFHIEMCPTENLTDDNTENNAFSVVLEEMEYFNADAEGVYDPAYNNYLVFDDAGISVTIRTPGTYTFKIGNWKPWDAADGENETDVKLAEIRFQKLEIEDTTYTLGSETVELPGGLLNPAQSEADYTDYKLNVAEAGDYTLTYHIGYMPWDNTTFDEAKPAFQTIVNPEEEGKVEYPATILTHLWGDLAMKQTVSLEAGEQVLRVQALSGGFSMPKIEVNKVTVSEVTVDDTSTSIPAINYSNGSNYHAIEGDTISYTSEGLRLDYAIDVEQSGVYTISYNYVSATESELQTQVDGVEVANSSVSKSDKDTWYEGSYQDSDTTGISFRLEEGKHTLSTIWSTADINIKSITLTCTTQDPPGKVFAVEGEYATAGKFWAVTPVRPEDSEDGQTGYLAFDQATQWANGRWVVKFEYPGDYEVEFEVATNNDLSDIQLDMGLTSGYDVSLPDQSGWTITNGSLTLPNTNGEWMTVDGPTVTIEESGYYDIKFGTWGANTPNFKLDRIWFACDNPKAQPEVNKTMKIKKGKELVIKEANAVDSKGSLRLNPASEDYVDYRLDVMESGDYRLTYSLASNEAAVKDAFQIKAAPLSDGEYTPGELTEEDFTIEVEPVQLSHYYESVQERQVIHLEAGSYVLRTEALSGGFSLTQLTITDTVSIDVAEEGATTIAATNFNHGTGYHAIQGESAENIGNIGYGAKNLTLDYTVSVTKAGVYDLVYKYVAGGDYSLTALRVADEKVYDLGKSELKKTEGDTDWYSCDWTETAPVKVLLPAGTYTFRVRWDSVDINLRSFALTYSGDTVAYVEELVNNLTAEENLTLDDEAAVVYAKECYDTLTEEEKTKFDAATEAKLEAALAQMDVLNLQKVIADNQKALDNAFAKYAESDYKPDAWETVKAAKDAGYEAIGAATTIEEANEALVNAKAAMAAVPQKLKSIVLTADNTVILAQSKAYQKNGSLNSNVAVGNYADYFVNVEEAGTYIFTYALYADEAVEDAFAIKYEDDEETREYPETVSKEYAKVSVPEVTEEGSLVKEIRGTIDLVAGEQTIRFEALSDKVRLNRITIQKQTALEIQPSEEDETVIPAGDFTEAEGQYVIVNNAVTETAADTKLQYLVSLEDAITGYLSYNYAYAGDKEPELVLSMVKEDGTTEEISSIRVTATEGSFAESDQTEITLPAGEYVLRVTMKNDGVDLKNFAIGGIPAEKIKLNAYLVTLNLNKTFRLEAGLTPENATSVVTFSSNKPEIASVDANGLVTAKGIGKAVITATAGTKTAECTVTVKESITSWQTLSLNANKIQLNPQGSYQLTATVEPKGVGNSAVTWKSSNAGIASVDANGLVKALASGPAVITAISAEGVTATCEVTVASVPTDTTGTDGANGTEDKKPVPVSFINRVEVNLSDELLYTGGNIRRTADIEVVVPTGAELASVTYVSDKASVATVSAKGVVKAKKAGTAVITANVTLTNGESASIQKTVTVKKAYIKLKKAKYTVKKGESIQLKATAYGSSTKITFSIADKKGKKLAKVTKAGKFTGKAKGTVKVVAKSGNVKKTFTVKVK